MADAKSFSKAKSYVPEVVKFTRIGGSGMAEADGQPGVGVFRVPEKQNCCSQTNT